MSINASEGRLEIYRDEDLAALSPSGRVELFEPYPELTVMLSWATTNIRNK